MIFVPVIANSFQTGEREDVWDGTRTFSFVCQCVHKTVKYLIFQNHHMHKVKSICKCSYIAGLGLLVTCHRKEIFQGTAETILWSSFHLLRHPRAVLLSHVSLSIHENGKG